MAIAWLMNLDFAAGPVEAAPAPPAAADPLIRPNELTTRRYDSDNVLKTDLYSKKTPRSYSDP